MKTNAWGYAEAFNEMESIYNDLGLDDNWLETLDKHDQLISNDAKAS
ncbi:hypothetical protein ACQCPP_12395 [Priestia megaterium]